jgi:hypothetical protein
MEQLENYILTETKKILKEEMGINREVQEATSNVLEFVNEILSHKEYYKEYLWDKNNPESKVYGVLGFCNYTLFEGFDIRLHIQMCIFDDKEKMNDAYKTLDNIEMYHYDFQSHIIAIHFPAYRPNFNYNKDIIQIGLKNTRIRGTISHEIKHAFQSFKKEQKGHKSNLNSYKKSRIYVKALEWNESKNKDEKLFGYAIYYCFPIEITANMESLFTSIKQNCNDLNEAINYIKASDISRSAQGISNLIHAINNNHFIENIFIKFKNDFHRDKKWLINHLNNGLKLLKRCIKRTINLSEQYFNNTQKPIDY